MKRSTGKSRGMVIGATVAVACILAWAATPAHAQDKVVVIPLIETYTGPPVLVAKTGQTVRYATGDDGDLEKGVDAPTPRFTDNSNGTVTDHLTELVWQKNGNCSKFYATDPYNYNYRPWAQAVQSTNKLAAGYCGLTDGSKAGDWRLPNRKELDSLIDLGQSNPALPPGCPLTFEAGNYWSSTTSAYYPGGAWVVYPYYGHSNHDSKDSSNYVLAVRGGQ